MSLLDLARQDIENITSNSNDFGVDVDFLSPNMDACTVACLVTTHHSGFNELGEPIDSRQASVAVSEAQLVDNYYTVRNGDGDVDLTGHLLSFYESTGEKKTYIAQRWLPDEAIGLIVIFLGEWAG